jgi:hypothetical protein
MSVLRAGSEQAGSVRAGSVRAGSVRAGPVRGDERLAEREAAVVGWDEVMRERLEARIPEGVDAHRDEERVLEHAAGERHRVALLARSLRHVDDDIADCCVEAPGDVVDPNVPA